MTDRTRIRKAFRSLQAAAKRNSLIASLSQKRKVQLLLGALGRGPATALAQGQRIALDSLVRQKHLVFRMDADTVLAQELPETPGIVFSEIPGWQALPAAFRARLEDPNAAPIDWGSRDWFDRGWRLWAAMEGKDNVAALGWWRSAEQSRDFFIPLPDDAELLWHVIVLPEYQGRRLQVPRAISLMQWRAREGVRAFFTNCRDYNTPSRRNIERMGFTCIGACTVSRITGRRRWLSYMPDNPG
jgi:hypothetical protein